ncbi:MAG: phosphohistidine phosphatase SixA [Deltaproteobacteria bacterium]|nr:phosphohistidine phosphatase SixA [Deltaproteobacteria bacterium]MDQ3297391.1 phosphohistidine phosphatase SixA [Myxococcota bacterium]
MQLFIIRHAIAEDAVPGQEDASRELTKDGKQKLRRIVKGLRRLGLDFDRILTSPWTRATQTAVLLRPLCEEPPLATDLLCSSPKAELFELVAELNETAAIVGHEPWLGELVAWLAFGDTRHGEALSLKKGGVVWLEGSAVPGGMTVRALLPPSVLRAVR